MEKEKEFIPYEVYCPNCNFVATVCDKTKPAPCLKCGTKVRRFNQVSGPFIKTPYHEDYGGP